jgi:hypothetical protein
MNDYDPVSPYLKRRIRTLEEAQKDQLTAGSSRYVVFRALEKSRARGDKSGQQFQHAVDALLASSPDLDEAVAVDTVHRFIKEEEAEGEET